MKAEILIYKYYSRSWILEKMSDIPKPVIKLKYSIYLCWGDICLNTKVLLHRYLSSRILELKTLLLTDFFVYWSRDDRSIEAESLMKFSTLWGRGKAKTITLSKLFCTLATNYQRKCSQQFTNLSTSFLTTAETRTWNWVYREWERGFLANTENFVAWKSCYADLWGKTERWTWTLNVIWKCCFIWREWQ